MPARTPDIPMPEMLNGKWTTGGRFAQHRRDARKRGIEFQFTFKQWCQWWQKHLGPDWFEKRGAKAGQYVMARKGDVGPYHPNNVKCITSEENHSEGNLGRKMPTRTEAHRLNISLAKRGKPSSFKGKKHTEEAKAKLSAAKLAFWQRKRA